MVKNLPYQKLQQIVNFVKENYDTGEDYLLPKDVNDLIKQDGDSEVFISEDDHGIDGLSFVRFRGKSLAETYRTVVRLDCRGLGVGKKLNLVIENMLRNMKIHKIKCHIFTDNFPSIFKRLKEGYLIEGLLRNHDEPGKHEYILGKELR